MLDYLLNFIQEGMQAGHFTEGQARRDLQIALCMPLPATTSTNTNFTIGPPNGCPTPNPVPPAAAPGTYRYSCALTYCGRLEEARRYAEAGTREEPSYPWIWLQAGKLRAHFGDKAGGTGGRPAGPGPGAGGTMNL